MKPFLILGLGNPLMGDDGIGAYLAGCLASDPGLSRIADISPAGTDLLRWADDLEGRRQILLLDAIIGDGLPGSIEIFDAPFDLLESRQSGAHQLSVPQAVALLKIVSPALRDVRFTLIGIAIQSVEAHALLSRDLDLDNIESRVRSILQSELWAPPERLEEPPQRAPQQPELSRADPIDGSQRAAISRRSAPECL